MSWPLLSEAEAEAALTDDPRVADVATVLAKFYGGSAERSITGAVAILRALEAPNPDAPAELPEPATGSVG